MPSFNSSERPSSKTSRSDNNRRRPPTAERDNSSAQSQNRQAPTIGDAVNGKDSGQSSFDSHVSLLTEGKLSKPAYSPQRQEIFRQIQTTHGNRYAQRLADAIARKRDPSVQTKLTVGPAGDQYEQEADHVASEVVSQMSASPSADVQAEEQPGEDIQMKPVEQQIGMDGGDVDLGTEQAIERSRGNGKPLPNEVRTSMEGVFGADFSGVKVHTDSESDAMNRSMQARAFTSGQDIFFSKSAYKPNSPEGQETLAHELTHVVQQNGVEPMFDMVVSSPADRDEREAEDVGHIVSKYGDLTPKTLERMPEGEKIHRLKDARGDIQRATGQRVAWAVTKGIFMGIVNALMGPTRYLRGDERDEISSSWEAAGDNFNYPSPHMQRIAKTVIILQEIGAFAAWVTLLTGAGSIIAAAFAPAGLAASAILGTIATISTIVGGSIGIITAVLNSILAISNLVRAQGMLERSLARKEIMLVFWKDLAGAIAGSLAAIGGAVGFGALGGGQVLQSAKAIGTAGLGAHAAAMGTAMASDQAFAIGTEVQDELIGVGNEDRTANMLEDEHYQEYAMGQEATRGRDEVEAINEGEMGTGTVVDYGERNTGLTGGLTSNVLEELQNKQSKKKPVNLMRIQRAPIDPSAQEEDYSSQLMQELNKADSDTRAAESNMAKDKELLNEEKKELNASSSQNDDMKKELGKMDSLTDVESNLDKIGAESDSGLSKANEKDEEKATEKEPGKEAEVKSKEESMLDANKKIDDMEAESGEKFGGKKPGFFGKITGWFKKGTRGLRKWFLSGLSYLKDRIKDIFTKIKEKVAGIIVKFADLKEPVEGLQEELNIAQTGAPQAEAGIDEAMSGISASASQTDQLRDTIAEVRKAIRG